MRAADFAPQRSANATKFICAAASPCIDNCIFSNSAFYLLLPPGVTECHHKPHCVVSVQILGTLMKVTATSVGAGNCLDILPDFLQILLEKCLCDKLSRRNVL